MIRSSLWIFIFCIAICVSGCSENASQGQDREEKQGEVGVELAGKGVKKISLPSQPAGKYMLPEDFSSSLRRGVTVVYFAKIACPSCKKQDVIWQDVIGKLPEGAKAEKRFTYGIDARKYGVHQLPTMIFYRDGVEVKRNIGVMQKNDIYRALNRAL